MFISHKFSRAVLYGAPETSTGCSHWFFFSFFFCPVFAQINFTMLIFKRFNFTSSSFRTLRVTSNLFLCLHFSIAFFSPSSSRGNLNRDSRLLEWARDVKGERERGKRIQGSYACVCVCASNNQRNLNVHAIDLCVSINYRQTNKLSVIFVCCDASRKKTVFLLFFFCSDENRMEWRSKLRRNVMDKKKYVPNVRFFLSNRSFSHEICLIPMKSVAIWRIHC